MTVEREPGAGPVPAGRACLDFEPACNGPGCDAPARWVMACGGCGALGRAPMCDRHRRYLEDVVLPTHAALGNACVRCGVRVGFGTEWRAV